MFEVEISNNCSCVKYDDEGDEVLDEQGNPVPAEWCSDFCWTDPMDSIDFMLAEWMTANELDPKDEDISLYIGGDGIGWQSRSGYTIAKSNAKDVVERLSINGDYTLRFTQDGKDLSVRRSSHDEPMGTGPLVFRLATDEEIEFWEYSR